MKDYYRLFGIRCDASHSEVVQAYRRLARQTHPDTGHCAEVRQFIEVQEAWEVLGTPQRRREYDQQLRQHRQGERLRIAVPVAPRPLRPDPRVAPASGWFRGARPQPQRPLYKPSPDLELLLDPLEAHYGGSIPLAVILPARCSWCGGSGREVFFACRVCGGDGAVPKRVHVAVTIPPGVRSGTLATVRLDRYGLARQSLLLRIRIVEAEGSRR